MKKPFPALALARGMSVLLMPSIHTVMLYSTPAIANTWIGYILRFFAECVSSHLYMFLMGFFVSVSKRKNLMHTGLRSLLLFSSGYLLNVVRTFLPAKLGLIPEIFLHHYGATSEHLIPLILTGDILQFAGLGYLLIALIERGKHAAILGILLFILVALMSPLIRPIQSTYPLLNHGLALLFSKETNAFLPLFPWLCYPLAGMAAGKWLHSRWLQHQFLVLLLGLSLVATGAILMIIEPSGWEYDFYRSGPGGVLLHTGMVGLWLLFFQSGKKYIESTMLEQLLLFGSRHITTIYFIHWIILGWGLGIVGYQIQSFYSSLLAIVIINLVSYGSVHFYLQTQSMLSQKI